jgi:hypothetical protein
MNNIRVIGLGGYGKWVTTYLKSRLQEEYEDHPPVSLEMLAFDMIGQETNPSVRYSSYKSGERDYVTLSYPDDVEQQSLEGDFYHYHGDWQNELRAIRDGGGSLYVKSFVTQKTAQGFVLGGRSQANPAGEVRLTSRISFFIDYGALRKRLESLLVNDSIVYLVSSVAGGTGSGSFLDFLLLIQDILTEKRCNRVSVVTILALPAAFTKAKEGEPFDPLKANSYAAFRELSRMNMKGLKLGISYPPDGRRPQQMWDVVSRVTYVVDGSVRGQPTDEKHYFSSVPMVADFILASRQDLPDRDQGAPVGGDGKDFRTGTMVDNMVSQIGGQMETPWAKCHPEKAFSYCTFGTGRYLMDEKLLKESLAQKIAKAILSNYLAASRLGGSSPDQDEGGCATWHVGGGADSRQQDFCKGRGDRRGFLGHVVYGLRDAIDASSGGIDTELLRGAFDAASSTSGVRGTGIMRPTFDEKRLQVLMQSRTLTLENELLRNSVAGVLGDASLLDQPDSGPDHAKPLDKTVAAVLRWHFCHWRGDFDDRLRKEVLDLITHQDAQHIWGQGGLYSAFDFLAALREALERFRSSFARMCNEDKAKSANELLASLEEYAKENGKKGTQYMNLLRFRQEMTSEAALLVQKYKEYANRCTLELMRRVVVKLSEHFCESVSGTQDMVASWARTFDKGRKYLDRASNELSSHRTALRDISVDEYATKPGDRIEEDVYRALLPGTPDGGNAAIHQAIAASVTPVAIADLAREFGWDFNERLAADGSLPHPDEPEGSLVCSLPTDLPRWRGIDVVRWNYTFANYYLTKCVLGAKVRTDIIDVLLATGKTPQDVARTVRLMATPSLAYNRRAHEVTLESFPANADRPGEMAKYYVYGDEKGWLETELPAKRAWVKQFKTELSTRHESQLVDVPNEPGITAAGTWALITPVAMTSLQDSREAYVAATKSQRAVHILAGETRAVDYERDLSVLLDAGYRELHPLVVAALDDEALLTDMMLATLLGVAEWRKAADKGSKKTLDAFTIMEVPRTSGKGTEDVTILTTSPVPQTMRSLSAASLNLRIPALDDVNAVKYGNAVKWLDKKVTAALDKGRTNLLKIANKRFERLLEETRTDDGTDPIARDEKSVELVMLARLLEKVPQN